MSLLCFRRGVALRAVVLPVFKGERISELELNVDNGRAVFENGMQIAFNSSQMSLLDAYKFASKLRIRSLKASPRLMSMSNIWTSLKDVENLTLNGEFYQDFLEKLVKRCKSIKALSCAYWTTQSFAGLLEHISSSVLAELTVYVNGTKDSSSKVFDALAIRAIKEPKMIERLFLIFEESLTGDISTSVYTTISKCLASKANVYILYKNENGSFCMNSLLAEKYEFGGFIQLAENCTSYVDSSPMKKFARYKLFKKTHGDCTFVIGCGKGICYQDGEISILPSNAVWSEYSWKSKHIGHFALYPLPQTNFVPVPSPIDLPCVLNHDDENGNQMTVLEAPCILMTVEHATTCCNFDEYEKCQLAKNCTPFCIPFWENSTTYASVDHISFFQGKIEYRFSNGIYFQAMSLKFALQYMGDTSWCTSKLVKIFNASNGGLSNVLKQLCNIFYNASQVEFAGVWTTSELLHLVSQLPHSLESIVMMRLDVSDFVFKDFVKAIPNSSKENLKKMCLDLRGTPTESLASVIAALVSEDKVMSRLERVFLSLKQIDGADSPMTISNGLNKLDVIARYGSEVILMVDQNIDDDSLEYMQCDSPTEVLVPSMYDKATQYCSESYLMNLCGCKLDSAKFKLLFPNQWF